MLLMIFHAISNYYFCALSSLRLSVLFFTPFPTMGVKRSLGNARLNRARARHQSVGEKMTRLCNDRIQV